MRAWSLIMAIAMPMLIPTIARTVAILKLTDDAVMLAPAA
jgi:hypothetical protein